MPENRLNIITIHEPSETPAASHASKVHELRAQLERQWLIDPNQFNPLRNCMERERLERTWLLIQRHIDVQGKQIADVGCAAGVFTRRLREAGAEMTGVDIAENALKQFSLTDSNHIILIQGTLPNTPLSDQSFDMVVCTDVLAYLPKGEYRLFFAELARLLPSEGLLVCSSPIDIHTEQGVERLVELAQTEFEILEDCTSHFAFYLKIKHFLKTPLLIIRGWHHSDVRRKELVNRRGLSYGWYWLNTAPPFVWIWALLEFLSRPLLKLINNSRRLLLFLEKICRFFSSDSGINHYLFIGRKRPIQTVDPKEIPIEHPKRKEIWE
jgi:2-polyprenyl-3-methyl-5-hydroxy-6-metoxy-1,4-benzoquinol methylase